jgi:hypothetical protein
MKLAKERLDAAILQETEQHSALKKQTGEDREYTQAELQTMADTVEKQRETADAHEKAILEREELAKAGANEEAMKLADARCAEAAASQLISLDTTEERPVKTDAEIIAEISERQKEAIHDAAEMKELIEAVKNYDPNAASLPPSDEFSMSGGGMGGDSMGGGAGGTAFQPEHHEREMEDVRGLSVLEGGTASPYARAASEGGEDEVNSRSAVTMPGGGEGHIGDRTESFVDAQYQAMQAMNDGDIGGGHPPDSRGPVVEEMPAVPVVNEDTRSMAPPPQEPAVEERESATLKKEPGMSFVDTNTSMMDDTILPQPRSERDVEQQTRELKETLEHVEEMKRTASLVQEAVRQKQGGVVDPPADSNSGSSYRPEKPSKKPRDKTVPLSEAGDGSNIGRRDTVETKRDIDKRRRKSLFDDDEEGI